eukprot:gene84-87_t
MEAEEDGEHDIFSKYDFGERIGQGGFGQVLAVTMKRSKREERAVKILVRNEAQDERKIQEEGEIMTRLRHPNVIKLYDIYEDDLIVYIHSLQIIHRDIKPENWLFSKPDSVEGLKLIDFGLAKIITDASKKLSAPCGTLHYVAPETLGGCYSYPVDVWGVGVIIYLMLYGFYPFDGENTEQIMKAIVRKPLSHPNDCGTFLSGPGKRFLGRVLAKRGSSRYNAEQALADHWLQNEDLVTVIAAETVSEARKVSVQFSVDA